MKKCTFKTTGVCPKTCDAYEFFDPRFAQDNICLVQQFHDLLKRIHEASGKLLTLFAEALASQK